MEKPTAYKGGAPTNSLLDLAWKHANEHMDTNPNLRIILDIESGFPQVVTKEYYEAYLKIWKDLKCGCNMKIDNNKLFIFGTGGEIFDENYFKDLFLKT